MTNGEIDEVLEDIDGTLALIDERLAQSSCSWQETCIGPSIFSWPRSDPA